jgi:hypothetical protein
MALWVSVSLQDDETGNYNVYANSLTKQALKSLLQTPVLLRVQPRHKVCVL